MHIITYASHNDRYLDVLRASCPEITVLGLGVPWRGFMDKVAATVKFCRGLRDPDELVCFVDGFDSVMLAKSAELEEKYRRLFGGAVVLSRDKRPSYGEVMDKYVQAKLFGTCGGKTLNSGMYMGPAAAVADFWEGMKQGDDDQTHASRVCRKSASRGAISSAVAIDTEHALFYNYSSADRLEYPGDGRLRVGTQLPCAVSAPARGDINHVLRRLGFSDEQLPAIRPDPVFSFKTYAHAFVIEAAAVAVIVAIFVTVENRLLASAAAFLIAAQLVAYQTFVKHMELPGPRKAVYFAIETAHVALVMYMYYLFYNPGCDLTKLLLLNTVYAGLFFSAAVFKRCVVTALADRVTGVTQPHISPFHVIGFLFRPDAVYPEGKVTGSVDDAMRCRLTRMWMDAQRAPAAVLLLLNAWCLYRRVVRRR